MTASVSPLLVGKKLSRFSKLYTSSPMAKVIVREYFGLDEQQILPLSISHGIDLDHELFAQDVMRAEPIHWAYDHEINARSNTVKTVIDLSRACWRMAIGF
jgi:hypothetical protein